MTRKEEIEQAAKIRADQYSHPVEWNDCYHHWIEGAEWADNHPNLTWEDIRKICLIAENVHKYYGFWSQNVYEEIFNRFYKPEIWT